MISITDKILKEIEDSSEIDSKFHLQVSLEEKMRGMGVDRFWSNLEKARDRNQETSTRPTRKLMHYSIEKVVSGIEEFVKVATSGKAGKKHTAVKFLQLLEPEALALITARSVLDGIAKGISLVPLARRISSMVQDELSFREFAKADPETYKWLLKREKTENGSNYQRQRTSMIHNMNTREIAPINWAAREEVIVGSKLIEIMVTTTGLVQQVVRTTGQKRQEIFVEATPETIKWLTEENTHSALMSPVYLATIIPPRPWTTPTSGGYWTPRVRKLSLVKTNSKAYLEELADHDMPDVYDAVNAMQHTAWAINRDVLEAVKNLWEAGTTMGGIPSADDLALPTKPLFLEEGLPKEVWTEDHLKKFKKWKRAAKDVYSANAKLKSLRLQFAKVMMVADIFRDEDTIYFPHQLDFRGRAYAVPLFLNPQGADVAKGLLTFANGVAINDEESSAWLAIHGCNCFGNDKISLEDRVLWAEYNTQEIVACANDPYNSELWVRADKPFQFLAFCFEWAAFVKQGFGFVSTLPIAMDGSCNGLQNFSGMLLDKVGGAAVNLTPSDLPADVYNEVAQRVIERAEQDAASDDEELAAMAQGWLKFGITRSVCKRPVMTLCYGSKAYGFKTQVFEDTVRPAKFALGDEFPWEGSGWAAAAYMGNVIWECVGKVVVAARQAMDWFQESAGIAAKEGLPVRWTTPDNLVVLQAYPKITTSRIKLAFNGVRHDVSLAAAPTKELDRAKQKNGISPNFIHGCDASHMRSSVRRCHVLGIQSFSLIHDSYGTHAGNSGVLAEVLREAFVDMYSGDILQDFKTELEQQLPPDVKLPPLPLKGTLDLQLVKASKYFFA